MQTVNSAGTPAAGTKNIYASNSGGKQYKPFSIAEDAPVYNYKVPGHDLNTWALKDQGGQEWYLTDGGNWRNVQSRALSPTAPTYAPAAPAPTTPPANTAPTPETPPPTWKSIWDFMPKQTQDAFNVGPEPTLAPTKSYWDYFPKDPTTSPTYQYNLDKANTELTRNLSKMGLLGSGAELEKRESAQAKVASDETDRLMKGAEVDAQNDKDRALAEYTAANTRRNSLMSAIASLIGSDFNAYTNAAEGDKDREISKDGQKLNAIGMALDFLSGINPMNYAFQATNTTAENQIALSKLMAQLAGSGGGGGGSSGGGSSAADLPPSAGGFDSTGYWMDTVSKLLPTLITAFK